MNYEQAKEYLETLGIKVIESQTTPTRAGKKPRSVWNITGNIAGYEQVLYDLELRKYHGKFNAWDEDTVIKIAESLENETRLTFAEQQQAKASRASYRASRLQKRALKHLSKSKTHYGVYRKIADGIPFGQPILVGHHSEKRHRRDAERIYCNMRKHVDEQNYAEHLQERAAIAQAKSENKHQTLEYLGNRIQECQAKLNSIQRRLDGKELGIPESTTNNPKVREMWEQEKAQIQEQLNYWQLIVEEKGGVKYSKDNIKVGDWIKSTGWWYQVYRVNKKSVSCRYFQPNQGWSNTVEYFDIRGYCRKEDAIKYAESQGFKNIQEQNKTNLDLDEASK